MENASRNARRYIKGHAFNDTFVAQLHQMTTVFPVASMTEFGGTLAVRSRTSTVS